MKLGTQTGSLINHFISNTSVEEIIPGETGATILGWTDRHPATVMDVFEAGKFTYLHVVRDDFEVVNGSIHDGSAEYKYTPRPDDAGDHYRFKTDGSSGFEKVFWNKETNRWNVISKGGLSVGRREKYYDPHF